MAGKSVKQEADETKRRKQAQAALSRSVIRLTLARTDSTS